MIINKMKEGNNQLFLIAEVKGTIVGNLIFRGGVRVRTQHVGEFGVSIIKEYWGFGIGKLLIEELLEWARKGGIIKKINLKVRTDNHSAIYLYKKMGFQDEGLLTREFLIDGEFVDRFQMGLQIDQHI